MHKARQMPNEEFEQEVEKELAGRETEPWKIIYSTCSRARWRFIERAIETA